MNDTYSFLTFHSLLVFYRLKSVVRLEPSSFLIRSSPFFNPMIFFRLNIFRKNILLYHILPLGIFPLNLFFAIFLTSKPFARQTCAANSKLLAINVAQLAYCTVAAGFHWFFLRKCLTHYCYYFGRVPFKANSIVSRR